ncbi:MAG TPA: amidohydrolase [Candidatus Limnocylindria bacterium]|nr:amidohydrolase [Candidatus Limnocylindria bacterium]
MPGSVMLRDVRAAPAELLIVNGRAFVMGGQAQAAGASVVAVAGGRILGLGDEGDAAQWRGPQTEVIDAGGGTIMPAFGDAHMHLRHGALALDQLDLFGMSDVAVILAAVARFSAQRPDDEWLLGRGWMYGAFGGGLPDRHLLDAVVPDRPAYFACFDSHSGWANSRALEAAGITAETPDPPHGHIVRDASGQPTGALKERATELIAEQLPAVDETTMRRLTLRALTALAAAGIASAQDAWATPEDLGFLRALHDSDGLPIRLRVGLELRPDDDLLGQLEAFDVAKGSGETQDQLRGGILKSFLDGVIEARTAYMLRPYRDTPARGEPRWSDEGLRRAVAEAHRRGWQLELHAVGDAAVRQALDAYEALGAGEAARRRHRVEHIETLAPADLPRFAPLGVVASMQPLHALPEEAETDAWQAALEPAVAASGWPLRSLLAGGAVLALGSDWPVVPFDPFLELQAAVRRQSADGSPEGGWLPDEGVSLEQAMHAYTWGSAYAEHAEHERGKLAAGSRADLVVLDRDLLGEGDSAIVGTQVRLTLVDGRAVHRSI